MNGEARKHRVHRVRGAWCTNRRGSHTAGARGGMDV